MLQSLAFLHMSWQLTLAKSWEVGVICPVLKIQVQRGSEIFSQDHKANKESISSRHDISSRKCCTIETVVCLTGQSSGYFPALGLKGAPCSMLGE